MGKGKRKSLQNLFCKMLSGLLCVILIVTSVAPAALQVSASELPSGQEQASEYEADSKGDSADSTGADTDGSDRDGETGESQTSGSEAGEEGAETQTPGGETGTEGNGTETPGDENGGEGNGMQTPDDENGTEGNGTETPDGEIGTEGNGTETPDGENGGEGNEAETPDDEAGEEDPDADVLGDAEVDNMELEAEAEAELLGSARAAVIGSGTNGNFKWSLTDTGILTLSGSGVMSRTDSGDTPWEAYDDWFIQEAIVNVTSFTNDNSGLGLSNMFNDCKGLTKVTFKNKNCTSAIKNMSGMFKNCSSLTEIIGISNLNTSSAENMSSMFYGCRWLGTLDLSGWNTGKVTNMSSMFLGCTNLKTLEVDDWNTGKVTNMSSMFYNCSSLIDFNYSELLDTSSATNMSYMFYGSANSQYLQELNFDNTSNVTNMSYMFANTNLKSINLNGLDTSSVENMSYMFATVGYSHNYLESVDMSNLDTRNVTDMSYMFANTYGYSDYTHLKSVTMSNLNTIKLTNMKNMFYNCSNLTTVNWDNIDTSNVTDIGYMFYNCKKLTTVNWGDIDTSNVTDMGYMFYGCTGLAALNFEDFETNSVINMQNMFYNCSNLQALDLSSFETDNVQYMSYMFYNCRSLTELKLSNFVTSKVTDMGYVFSKCSSLTDLDLSSFRTSNVIYMTGMFEDCSSLVNLNLDGFDTGNVRLMSYMFNNCSSLAALDLSDFTTGNVSSSSYSGAVAFCGGMEYMFNNCGSLTTLDLSTFDTGSVLYMNNMFSGCSGITELTLDVEKFKTNSVTTMASMFSGCSRLKDLDVSGFDTASVINMNSMFKDCNSLGDIDEGEEVKFNVGNFNTGNVTDMTDMFSRCNSLTHLDVSNFNTDKVTKMCGMFFLCLKLEELDLSNFNTSAVTDMHDMFYSCRKLQELDMSSFDVANVIDVWCMISECTGLNVIHTPRNLTLTAALPKDKPDDAWYRSGSDNNVITALPQNLDKSIMLIKNKEFKYPCIIIQKVKTTYNRGEELSLDDLTVTYYDIDGNPTVIEDGYTTNADEIDMRMSDTETLKVTYVKDGQEFSDTVELKITGKMQVDISGIDIDNITYNAESVSYYGQPVVKLKLDGSLVPYSDITLMYGYGGRLADGTAYPYTDSGKPPIDAGVYYLRISISEDNEYYTGDVVIPFDIYKAPVTITANDLIISKDDELPDTYEYEVEGLLKGRELDTEPSFKCDVDITTIGIYDIIPHGADAGINYNITYKNGKLTVTGKKIVDITGITINNSVYNTKPVSYRGKAVVKIAGKGEVVTDSVERLIYSYSGMLADGNTVYTDYDNPPVDAGNYALTVSVPEDDELFIGTKTYPFKITKAPVRITAEDVTLNVNDALPAVYEYSVTGLLNEKTLDTEPLVECDVADTSQEGIYIIVPYGADAGDNYEISYINGVLTINIPEPIDEPDDKPNDEPSDDPGDDPDDGLNVDDIPRQVYTGKQIKPEVRVYASDGVTLLKEKKDYTVKFFNNINADTDNEASRKIDPSRDGNGDDGFTKGMAYVVVTGRGNYSGSVYRNFYIDPISISEDGKTEADGFKLKYKDQLITGKKAQKPFQSIKYKKAMKADKDYTLTLTALEAFNDKNEALVKGEPIQADGVLAVPANYYGTFELTIEGIENYKGKLTKTIYVSDKKHLMKNAKIALGKNIQKIDYTDGKPAVLTPAYYDANAKAYYVKNEDGTVVTADKKDVFTVKMGGVYLEYGDDKDFTIGYANNGRVGTATMTIIGKGKYTGTKSAAFRINGAAFNAKTVTVSNFEDSMPYNGTGRTQNNVVLTCNTGSGEGTGKELVRDTHYTVKYKNELNKGTATMIFTAKPESGYSGSFKKTYKIEAADFGDAVSVSAVDDGAGDVVEIRGENEYRLKGTVNYTKEGAKPSDRVKLILGAKTEAPITLTEGKDYTVSYQNNSLPADTEASVMIMNGKGNYKGTLTVSFNISKAAMEGNDNLTVTTTEVAYNARRGTGYQYMPAIKVTDGKKPLTENQDYTVVRYRNTQAEVDAYLKAKEDGAEESVLQNLRPYAIITATGESGYTGSMRADLTVYRTRLKKNMLYVVLTGAPEQTTYNGEHLRPDVAVYYGDANAVKAAAKAEITNDATLTYEEGEYKLTRLKLKEGENDGDYTLTYGDNIKVGKNKGSITVNGTGIYGGRVVVRFTIQGKDVYDSPVEPWSRITEKMKMIFAD